VIGWQAWLWSLACGLAEMASFFGELQGRAFPLVEAHGVGPVNAGAADAVEGGHSMTRTPAGCGTLGVCDRDPCIGVACNAK
jgi:hypothetical protein